MNRAREVECSDQSIEFGRVGGIVIPKTFLQKEMSLSGLCNVRLTGLKGSEAKAGGSVTYLLKELVHEAFLHPHGDFILLLRRLLPLETQRHTDGYQDQDLKYDRLMSLFAPIKGKD